MSAQPQKITSIVRVDLDTDETRLQPGSATNVKGWTWEVNKNGSGEGYNAGVATPREGAALQSGAITLPAGDNICVGTYESKESNELYVWVHNSNSNHLIYRINGSDGTSTIVYRGKYLKLSLRPEFYIGEGRATLKMVKYYNKATGNIEQHKYLEWVERLNQPRFLSVEDSIRTDSFNPNSYPYFAPFATNPNDIDRQLEKYINLAVETPLGCITFEPLVRLPNDVDKQNLMLYKGWQWRVKHIDVWGRESEHGVISDRYFTLIGSNCLASSNSISRCVRLTIPAGSPLVNKIVIEFRTCATNSDLSIDGDWYLYDTIDKYDESAAVNFWMRSINNPYQDEMDVINAAPPGTYTQQQIAEMTQGLTSYDASTNTFGYTFCADKQCSLISQTETQRTDNLVPRTSSSVFSLSEGIGLANNLRGFEPISPDDVSKIAVEAVVPADACAAAGLRRIVVYALIYSPAASGDSILYGFTKYYDPPSVVQDLPLNCCGGSDVLKHHVTWGTYPQSDRPGQHVFTEGQDNFVFFLAGTPYFAIGKQVIIDRGTLGECPSGNIMFDGVTVENSDCQMARDAGAIAFQKFELFVPPGEYVGRFASHMCNTREDYQSTSTFVSGKRSFGDFQNNTPFHKPSSFVKEMVIDVSTGDFIAKGAQYDFFMIQALLSTGGGGAANYVKEDAIDRIPISLAKLSLQGDGTTPGGLALERWSSLYTDHNGFYFSSRGINQGVYVVIDRCDEASLPGGTVYTPDMPGTPDSWGGIACVKSPLSECTNELFLYAGSARMPDVNRRVIRGTVKLCDTEIGVSGVVVVPYNLRPVRTDAKGEWIVVTHGREKLPDNLKRDEFILTQSGCSISNCGDPCDSSFDHIVVQYITCNSGSRNTTTDAKYVAIGGVNQSGPQNGGRYQFGVVFHDGNGRHGFVQTGDNLLVDVPSMIATKRFVHSTFQFSIDNTFQAPEWAEYMSFCTTRNIAWQDFFMWSADRIAFADAAGNEGVSFPTKIRIYYESMVEYQKQNNLNTNAVWQFISTGDNQSTQILGDVIEFYRNGDGTWLNELVQYNVRYNNAGKYIEIDYVENLKNLKEGTLFKVLRPKECTNTEPFMELCPTVKIINRVPQLQSGTLAYRDSYILSRTFPVPIYTTNPDDPTIVTKSVSVRYSNDFYEHHSPSDFWGSHCTTRGRVFFKNPYERQQFLETEIAVSAPILNRSNFNGLSYFLDSARYRFDEQEWGSITVVLPEITTLLVLCKHNNFIVGYSDTTVKVDDNGNVVAGSLPGAFGAPQRKIGQAFGCLDVDIPSIKKRNGIVVFIDRTKSELVYHAYSQAVGVSGVGFKGWLNRKIARQNSNNRDPFASIYRIFVGGIDPKYNEYYLTDTYLPGFITAPYTSPDSKFLNLLTEPTINADETIVVDMLSMAMKGFAAFTPEAYGALEGFHTDRNLLMMRRGHSWSLHAGNPATPLLNYFGVQTNKVIEYVCNISSEKVKRFMYLEVYNSKHVLIATRIVTEENQMSRIQEGHWDKRDSFYCAPFLCDINTPADPNAADATGSNAIIDGNPMYGRWIKVKLEGKASDAAAYTELSGIVTYVIPSGQSAD